MMKCGSVEFDFEYQNYTEFDEICFQIEEENAIKSVQTSIINEAGASKVCVVCVAFKLKQKSEIKSVGELAISEAGASEICDCFRIETESEI